ncbi:MAG TPA: zf-TFIIB domain-containing protein [Pseudonocardia sp.]
MNCPKCRNVMHTVNRGGIHIEQCQGCRGIFLDRGELEQISNAEHSYYGPTGGAPVHYSDSPPPYGSHGHDRHHSGHYSDSPPPYGHSGHGRRKKSFLEGLFD